MKICIPIVLFISILVSCGVNQKKTNQASDQTNEPNTNGAIKIELNYLGVVQKDKKCGFIIDVRTQNDQVSFAPKNLPEQYQVPGMGLAFSTIDYPDEQNKCGAHYIITLTKIDLAPELKRINPPRN